MKPPVVVVDANQIIERDWRLEKPLWQVVLGLAATGQIDLRVPEVVVRECVARFRDRAAEPSHALAKLGVEFDLDEVVTVYEQDMRARLAEAGTVVSRDDPITLLDLVDHAVKRRPPFDSSGSGFRDAILWAYVTRFAVGNLVVFLTSDGDFLAGHGEDRRLHPDLDASVVGGVVQWYPDIRAWFEATGRSVTNPAVEGRLLKLIRSDRAQFNTNVIIAIDQASLVASGLPDVALTLETVAPPIEIVATTLLEEPGDGRFLVRMTVQADGSGTARTGTSVRTSIVGEFTGRVTAEVEAFYDMAADQLENIRVEVVQVDARDAAAAINSGRSRLDGRRDPPTASIEGLRELSERLGDVAQGFDLGKLDTIDSDILRNLLPKWTPPDLGIDPNIVRNLLPKWTLQPSLT